MNEAGKDPVIFINALIASLALLGVKKISRYGKDNAKLMAMYTLVREEYERLNALAGSKGDPWLKFVMRAKNTLDPTENGEFWHLRNWLLRKTSTLVNIESDYFVLNADQGLAKSILNNIGDDAVCELSARLAKAFTEAT